MKVFGRIQLIFDMILQYFRIIFLKLEIEPLGDIFYPEKICIIMTYQGGDKGIS